MWMKALLIGLVFSSISTALKDNQGNVTGCLVTADEYEDVSLKHYTLSSRLKKVLINII